MAESTVQRVYADERVAIDLVPALGFLANNVYLLRALAAPDRLTLVDFPQGVQAVFPLLGGARIDRVLLTHAHFDHTRGYAELRAHTDAPIFAGRDDLPDLDAAWGVRPIDHGEHIDLGGGATVEAIHTPGHTPGSTCFRVHGDAPAAAVCSGDTLFPGGPGRSASAADLRRELTSIRERLLPLPPDTVVLPGHGGGTTIAVAREEHAIFSQRPHPPDLHGDVSWLES